MELRGLKLDKIVTQIKIFLPHLAS